MGTLLQDLRYGARMLRKNSGFTAVAVLSLGLGIGANTAIFQLLDAVRLRTIPVKDPQELALVQLADRTGWRGSQASSYPALTHPLWARFRDRQDAFSGVLAWANNDFNLAPGGEVRLARGLFVSGDFFRVLAVPALLGRVFSTADDRPGCGLPGAVIGHAFWQREFGDDPSAVGRTLKLNDHPVEVIALTPAGLTGLEGLLITQADFARLKVPSGRRLAFVRDLLDRMRTIPGVVSAGEVGILPLSGGGVDNNVWEEFRALAFLSPTQSSEPDPFTQVVIRSPAPLTELISRVRSAVAEVDPAIGLDFRAFETTVREGLLRERMMAALSSFFGGLATLIAAIGLYGVMSFLVMRRTNEIGIRMALGADARNVLALVLPESATLLALGLLAGTGLALAAARTADAMLFGLKSYDPGTLALAAALLAAVTGAATYLPARRAARLDPMAALREE